MSLLYVYWYFSWQFSRNIRMFYAASYLCYCGYSPATVADPDKCYFQGVLDVGRRSREWSMGRDLSNSQPSRTFGIVVSSHRRVHGGAPVENDFWTFHVTQFYHLYAIEVGKITLHARISSVAIDKILRRWMRKTNANKCFLKLLPLPLLLLLLIIIMSRDYKLQSKRSIIYLPQSVLIHSFPSIP